MHMLRTELFWNETYINHPMWSFYRTQTLVAAEQPHLLIPHIPFLENDPPLRTEGLFP